MRCGPAAGVAAATEPVRSPIMAKSNVLAEAKGVDAGAGAASLAKPKSWAAKSSAKLHKAKGKAKSELQLKKGGAQGAGDATII